jgi:hypothetical protein
MAAKSRKAEPGPETPREVPPRAPQDVGGEPRLTREELAAYNARRLSPEAGAAWAVAHWLKALPVVGRPEEIPAGMSFEEARTFWDTHEVGEGLVRAAERRNIPKVPAPISLRLEADTVRRLRALAAKKGTRYQTLLKAFVQERLYEEEKREGLVS